MRACLAFLLLVFVALVVPTTARAQSAPQLSVQADVDTVAVGDVVHLQLTAQSADGMPSDPQPGATPGFAVRGQNQSPSQTHISINGSRTDRFGLLVDWTLLAQRVGVFSVGPPTITVAGTRYSARSITIRVVPAGQAPQRQQPQSQAPQPFSPFDPWRSLFPGFNLPTPPVDEPPSAPAVNTDPKLALDAPRGDFYFLHAAVDTTSAVVGQQVTFSVYEYLDAETNARFKIDASAEHEPTAADFVKRPLLKDGQEGVLQGFASVGGHVWQVTLVQRWALFPLHAGDLTIGPMSVALVQPRSGNVSQRTSETLHVRVTDPPAAGRPPGYALGDVGHFTLTGQVTPREIDQDAAVGVHLELSGTGNLPAELAPPARAGVEWLAPEVHEQLGVVGKDVFGGKRTFDYVVRLHTPGDVDLGDLSLPFWNPDQRRYEVARASLGKVHVKASAVAAAPSASAAEETLAGLPGPRDVLEGSAPSTSHLDDRPIFWLLGVGLWPAAFGLIVVGRAAGRGVARRVHHRRTSPATDLKDKVAAAEAASRGKDARAADAAIARALEAASVAHAG
ncbi:MAG TPA: BatD family protein, partial [Polyangiaceae bacterium]